MPFYEYQCSACGAEVEVLQKITDAPLKKCPECGKNQLQKLVSAPVFRLKGGGWYETDFKTDKDKKRNLAGENEAAESSRSDGSDPGSKKSATRSRAAGSSAKPAASARPAAKAAAKTGAKTGARAKAKAKAKSRTRK